MYYRCSWCTSRPVSIFILGSYSKTLDHYYTTAVTALTDYQSTGLSFCHNEMDYFILLHFELCCKAMHAVSHCWVTGGSACRWSFVFFARFPVLWSLFTSEGGRRCRRGCGGLQLVVPRYGECLGSLHSSLSVPCRWASPVLHSDNNAGVAGRKYVLGGKRHWQPQMWGSKLKYR